MFLTPNLTNNTTVQWQWRGNLSNPDSGSYSDGSSLTITGCPFDNTPPQVSNVSYTATVDVSDGAESVSINADFTDSQSYLNAMNFRLRGVYEDGSEFYYNGCNTWLIANLYTHNHTCVYSIPDIVPAQTMQWEAWARDRAENWATTVVGTLTITKDLIPDNFNPQILNVSYTQSIDITNGPQTVTISGDFTDVNEYRTSELERVYFVLRGNTGSGNIDIDQCDLFPSSGVTSISHSCTFTVPDTFPSQTMELRAYAKDAASNELNANVGGVAVTNNG